VRLCAVLAWCALASGDRLGAVVAYPSHLQRIKPAGQRRGILTVLQALVSSADSALATEPGAAPTTLALAVQQARVLAPSGSRVVILSDFQQLDETLEQHVLSLARRVEITPVCVRDALEEAIPASGVLAVKARHGNQAVALLDTGAKAQAAHTAKAIAARKKLDELFSLTGQSVSYVQSHDALADAATLAWFGVRAH